MLVLRRAIDLSRAQQPNALDRFVGELAGRLGKPAVLHDAYPDE